MIPGGRSVRTTAPTCTSISSSISSSMTPRALCVPKTPDVQMLPDQTTWSKQLGTNDVSRLSDRCRTCRMPTGLPWRPSPGRPRRRGPTSGPPAPLRAARRRRAAPRPCWRPPGPARRDRTAPAGGRSNGGRGEGHDRGRGNGMVRGSARPGTVAQMVAALDRNRLYIRTSVAGNNAGSRTKSGTEIGCVMIAHSGGRTLTHLPCSELTSETGDNWRASRTGPMMASSSGCCGPAGPAWRSTMRSRVS